LDGIGNGLILTALAGNQTSLHPLHNPVIGSPKLLNINPPDAANLKGAWHLALSCPFINGAMTDRRVRGFLEEPPLTHTAV